VIVETYHPLAPLGDKGVGVIVAVGEVDSYIMRVEPNPVRPAGSMHDPLTIADELSGPEYAVVDEQPPEIEVPEMSNVTGELYHP